MERELVREVSLIYRIASSIRNYVEGTTRGINVRLGQRNRVKYEVGRLGSKLRIMFFSLGLYGLTKN